MPQLNGSILILPAHITPGVELLNGFVLETLAQEHAQRRDIALLLQDAQKRCALKPKWGSVDETGVRNRFDPLQLLVPTRLEHPIMTVPSSNTNGINLIR
ncbi:hypothetical protein N7490_004928 [Penicillium lividum]|nr:hypothetical protein N7490_004928 [Penicillium lividum]